MTKFLKNEIYSVEENEKNIMNLSLFIFNLEEINNNGGENI